MTYAGRPIGARIREALEIVDRIGPATAAQVRRLMPVDMHRSNAKKYCHRATCMGFMTCDRTVSPMQFSVVPDWRERVDAKGKHLPAPAEQPKKKRAPRQRQGFALQSAWAGLAAQ